MKKIIVILATVFSVCFLVACGGETKQEVSVNSSGEEKVNNESVVPESTEKPTEAPAPEATPEPTPEPTADPVETLTALKEKAMAEYDKFVEYLQGRFDIAMEILEVIKEYPNFKESSTSNNILLTKAAFEENIPKGNISKIVEISNVLNTTIGYLAEDYPDLIETEEFKRLVEMQEYDMVYYNSYVAVYNDTLAISKVTGFEELPYPSFYENKIEY